MKREGIAVAGSVLVDEINNVLSYPDCGELSQIVSFSRAVGGCVSNVCLDLKKLSPEMVVIAIGKISDDENGRFITDTLSKGRINTDKLVICAEDRTSFTQVISVEKGQRTFFTYAGVSSQFGCEDIDIDSLNAKILHLGYFLLLKKIDAGDGVKILKEALSRGIETSIDLVSEDSDRYKDILQCLPFVDYLIINEYEAGRLTGITPETDNIRQIAQRLVDSGVRKKVIIHFKEGAVCLSDGKFTVLGSLKLPEGFIKGTTGAGDAFCSGALLGIYNGLSDSEILDNAVAAATAALTTYDAVSGLDRMEKLKELSKKYERFPLCL